MKAREILLPVARDVLGRNAATGTGGVIAVTADDPKAQLVGVLIVLLTLIADFVVEWRKRRQLNGAQLGGASQAPPPVDAA